MFDVDLEAIDNISCQNIAAWAHKFGGRKVVDRWAKWILKADVRYHGPSQGHRRGSL